MVLPAGIDELYIVDRLIYPAHLCQGRRAGSDFRPAFYFLPGFVEKLTPLKLTERNKILTGFKRPLIENHLFDGLLIFFGKYFRIELTLYHKYSIYLFFISLARTNLFFYAVCIRFFTVAADDFRFFQPAVKILSDGFTCTFYLVIPLIYLTDIFSLSGICYI